MGVGVSDKGVGASCTLLYSSGSSGHTKMLLQLFLNCVFKKFSSQYKEIKSLGFFN